MNVADALRTYERVKRARKQELCGFLEGGPDAYNYLPERCVKRSKRTGKKRQSSTLQAEQIPVTTPESGLSARSLEKLRKLVDRLSAKKTDQEIENLRKRTAALTGNPPNQTRQLVAEVTAPLIKILSEMPDFMAFACFKFIDSTFITAFPNHEERWNEVNRIWSGECKFTGDIGAKLSVMSFALKIMGTQ